jgi:predicted phage-related endonuclease
MSNKDWLTERKAGIGGSDVPIILGLSTFMTPFQLWAIKCGHADPPPAEEFTEWGHNLEDPIALAYAKKTGRQLFSPDMANVRGPSPYCPEASPKVLAHGAKNVLSLRSTRTDFMMGTIDRFIYKYQPWEGERDQSTLARGPGILEIKNVDVSKAKEWSGGPPLAAEAQLQSYLYVTGLLWGSIAGLIGGNRLVVYDVLRNETAITKILEHASAFWQHVKGQTPPPVDGDPGTATIIKEMFPHHVVGRRVVLQNARDIAAEILDCEAQERGLRATLKALTERKAEAQNKIKLAMGDAETASIPDAGIEFTWKSTERKGYYVKPSQVRTLRHTKPL